LDFQKLMHQIGSVGDESAEKLASLSEIIDTARDVYHDAAEKPHETVRRLEENLPWVLWPLARPLEPYGRSYPISDAKENTTIVAVDGSQIMPSQHEVHNCFLLNIGVIRIAYGLSTKPLLESYPHLYHKSDDLYPLVNRRRMHIDELYVSLERNLLELDYLVSQSIESQSLGSPVVALVDGSLIPWSVEKMPDHYQEKYFARTNLLLEKLRLAEIPIVGYLSHSRSSDVVNSLRVLKCPYDLSDCRTHCESLNEEDFPCSAVWPLLDRTLMKSLLAPGERSSIFLSGANVSKSYPNNQATCFTYVNVGEEIARLELPRWLFELPRAFDRAMAAILSQVRRGRGYPVALAEAHHLAVIKGGDRQRFFELLTRHLVSQGVSRVRLSPKESKKRIGLV
jgi:hypothetical protein